MKNSAVELMGAAQFVGVYKISVVAKSHVALDMADDDRLDVVGVFAASGGVAYMADSDAAVAQMGQLFLRKNFGYEAVAAVLPEKTVIRNSDAAAFLAAMLKRVESQINHFGHGRRFFSINTENAALFVKSVCHGIISFHASLKTKKRARVS